jgi:hypothetical protein
VLAWAQLGVATIHCLPANREAARELELLQSGSAVGSRIVRVEWDAGRQQLQGCSVVLCGHLAWDKLSPESVADERSLLAVAIAERQHVCLLSAPRSSRGAEFIRANMGRQVAELRHRNLGGLASAHVLVGWWGPGEQAGVIYPSRQKNPV